MCCNCHRPLDTQARGRFCSECWFLHVRRVIGEKALDEARMQMHELSSAGKVEQLSLFAEGK